MWLRRFLPLLLVLAAFTAEAAMPRHELGLKDLQADYDAAKSSRFKRARIGLGGSADAHLGQGSDYWNLREAARDMVRNDAVIGQAVERAVRNIHRTGFDLECQTGDDGLNAELWSAFHEWGNNKRLCDARGLNTFRRLGDLVLMAKFVDGDIFGLPLEDGYLQLLEGDRCLTPSNTRRRVVHGVLLDGFDRPQQYWFVPPGAGNRFVRKVSDVVPYDAWDEATGEPNVLHVFRANRYSATRGVPAFTPVANVASMLDDLQFAKLVQAQVVSCIAAFILNDGIPAMGPQTNVSEGNVDGGLSTRIEEKLRPGLMKRLPKGADIKAFSPNVPNAEYFEHARMLLRIVGVNLGLPLTLMMLDTENTTFHGYRGELQQAQLGFEVQQMDLAEDWYAPVFRWKARQFVEGGALKSNVARQKLDDGSLFRHKWTPPAWPYVDPLKDAQADALMIEKGLDSPRAVHASRGRDHDDVVDETVRDNEDLIKRAIESAQRLSKSAGTPVTWREVLNPLQPVAAVAAPAKPEGKKPAPEPETEEGEEEGGEDA